MGLVVNDFASVSAGDLKALVEVLALLPNLRYLDLGGIPGLPTRSDTLLALLSVVPPLRSLVGFSIAPSNYRSAAATLSALATTLESLSIVEAEEMEPVLEVRRQPSVHLPALRYLEVVPPDSTITREKTVYESWTIPLLRTVFVGGQFQYAVMAEGYADTAIFAGKSSIEETTLLMDFAVSPEDYHSLEPFDNLRTLAIHICEDDLWASDPVNVGGGFTHPSVSTLILIQESTEILHEGTPESHRAVYPKIARLASKSTFPSLKKVYYVTENVDGHVWNLCVLFSLADPAALPLTRSLVPISDGLALPSISSRPASTSSTSEART